MITQTATRAPPAIGKDPPMTPNVPKNIHALIKQAIPDPHSALNYFSALDQWIIDLRRAGRDEEADDYLEETRADLEAIVVQNGIAKSRARFKVVATYFVPALIAILSRILTDHLPFV
ncbi:hypothetical protein [Rhizobium tumorigenes]|uniref:Uncharacterized protein n=1 Tax=Rhizobium tumorigenes TaxID=2041385 RepID=A0AAF1KC57_9HYPH|nr:hypothetical protein [Rhizobium tumorigenes]WFR98704.1 hypothetical protein PR017_23680 [Rhizobium tumorigenes]